MREENAPVTEPTAQENFPLDDAVITLLAEYDQQIIAVNHQRQGVLVLFLRQHDLKGNWQLAPNGRELVRKPTE